MSAYCILRLLCDAVLCVFVRVCDAFSLDLASLGRRIIQALVANAAPACDVTWPPHVREIHRVATLPSRIKLV